MGAPQRQLLALPDVCSSGYCADAPPTLVPGSLTTAFTPPTTVPGVQRVTVSRTAEVAMVSISAAPPADQQTSASAWAARVAGGTGACEPVRRRSFPSRALLQHASVAGGGGGGGGAGQQRSSLHVLGKPAPPCRADPCLVVGRWLRRRRASSTSVNPPRRPSRRSPRRPRPSRLAPTTRENAALEPKA